MAAKPYIITELAQTLDIRECREWSELERLLPDWNRIIASNPSSLFATPEWLGPWWRAYGKGKQLLALVFSDDGRVVGIAPFYVEKIRKATFSLRRLRLVGDGSRDSDDLDFVVSPGYEGAVAKRLLNWLESSKAWDLCELNCMSNRSAVTALLQQTVPALRWKHMSGSRPTAIVKFSGTWEDYLKGLSSKERRKIGQRYRGVERRYRARFFKCQTLDELPERVEDLFRIHQLRRHARGQPGAFALAERRNFYREMTADLMRRGWLELWFLELDGKTVSTQIGMRWGSTFHALQEGFDPAYIKESVGYVLRSHIMRYCVESGFTQYDFLAGDQESKQKWGAQIEQYVDFHFARPGSAGVPYLITADAIRCAKRWLRRNLPSPVVDRIRAFREARAHRGAPPTELDTND